MTEHHIQRKLRQVAEALACTVPLVGNALGHIQDELALTDGYKSTTIGDGGSRSTAELTHDERGDRSVTGENDLVAEWAAVQKEWTL